MTRPGRALRVGVIGVGRIGLFHLETLLSLDDVASVVVTDADAEHGARVAAAHGVEAVESPEALVESGVDAFVVATPTPEHAPMLRLAAAAGIPAFCEKPVALEVAALDDVIETVRAAGIPVQVGFQRRFDAGYRAARDAVATGRTGKVLAVRAATHDPAPPAEGYIARSGGIFRDLHIHDFDAIRFVTGDEVTEVYADGSVREAEWFARHGDVDTAAAVLRLGSGALAILTGTRFDPRGYDVRLEVFGTRDSLAVGLDSRSPLRSVESDGPDPRGNGYRNFLDRFADAYRAELATFVECVREGRPSVCSLEEARAALVVALAADRSRAERRPVAIAEVG